MDQQERALQYFLLPSANPPAHLVAVHNRVYTFWKSMWEKVMKDLKADASHLEEDFIRQDFIAAICSDQEVVAVHLYSFFALDSLAARDHRYLSGNYPKEFFEKVGKAGIRNVMSLEYLTVNPAWRKHSSKVHMGAALGALGLNVMCQYGIDAVIAPARRDHKIHEMAYAQGGDCIIPEVNVHGVSCDLIAIKRENIVCPDKNVASLRDELWERRYHFSSTESVKGSGGKLERVA